MHIPSKQWHRSPLKRCFVFCFGAGYVQHVVWINNFLKRTSAIKVVSHNENYRQFQLGIEAIACVPQNQHLLWWAKINGTQRRTPVCPLRVDIMNSSATKGTSRDEVMSNSEKINPITLAVIESRLSEGTRWLVS